MFKDLFKDTKKLIIFLAVVAILVVILVCVVMGLFVDNNSFGNKINIKSEYEKLNNVATEDGKKYPRVSLPKDNKLKESTYDEVLEIFTVGKDAVIYLGYPKCLYCRSAIQVLVDTAIDTDLEYIYYLDIEEKNDKYDELLNILGESFVDNTSADRKIYAPSVLFVAKGKVVTYKKGTLSTDSDPYTELDASLVRGLSEFYSYGIRDVLASMNDK